MNGLLAELKRRNVFRVAALYGVVGWLLAQAAGLLETALAMPGWFDTVVVSLLLIGFPLALVLAWAYEMTPEGVKRSAEVAAGEGGGPGTGRRLDYVIIGGLVIVAVMVVANRVMPPATARAPQREAAANAAPDPGQALAANAEAAGDPAVPQKSVAVLPFLPLSSGQNDSYFADGLTEEIINSLTTLPDLLVTARTSAFHFKGTNTPVPEIAEALGVAHVVEGSVRRAGEEVRITAQLIRAEDGFHLWSQTYDRSLEDVFAVQTDIAGKVADALGVFLDGQMRARMADSGIRDVEVFLAFQRGRQLYQKAHGNAPLVPTLALANAELDAALARMPELAQAYLLRTDLYTHILFGDAGSADPGMTQEEALAQLHSSLEAAVTYESDRGQRLVMEAVRTFLSADWHGLGAQIDDSYEFWHNCEVGVWMQPMAIAFQRYEPSYARNLERLRCDPLNHLYWSEAMDGALLLGRPEESLRLGKEAENAIGGRPGYITSSFINALLAMGRFEQAGSLLHQEESGNAFDAARIDAAAGRAGDWDAWRMSLQDDAQDRLLAAAVFGDRNEANRIAAAMDGHPLGAAELARVAYLCLCGAPFDLSATPNLARQLKEGDLPWPPKSPIEWPLKQW